jgi:PAS domain S-box-containing protein
MTVSNDWFHSIFRHTAASMALTSPDYGFLKVNPAFCRFLGYDMGELSQLGIAAVTHPDDREPPPADEETPERHRTLTKEQRYLRKDGSIAWGRAAITWFFDGDGHPVYGAYLIQDISDLKRTEVQIEELNASLAQRAAELETANRELDAFSHTVSHDLRAPLTGIAGFSELLLQLCGDTLTEQCREYLEQILAASIRMGLLINALLNFSRLSRSELRRETVDLSGIAEEVVVELRLQDMGRRLQLRITPGVTVTGDGRLLRVVLQNLLENAWKYTGRTAQASIEFGVTTKGGEPAYFVRDNGIGFDMARAELLFAPFQRLHGEDEFPGCGIGLTTVKRIVHRHGGRVWAKGEPGLGATFYFTLPQP